MTSMVLRSVHLPPELDEELRAIAFDLRLAKADLIRAFLQHGLDDVKPMLANARTPVSRSLLVERLGAGQFPGRLPVSAEVSQFAPRLYSMKINPDKIRDVIGTGGATIRTLTDETGCTIDIAEDGTITIASTDAGKAEQAKKRIEELTAEVEVGNVYEGRITKILDFGALVNLIPGKDGLLHISQIAHQRVEKVTDFLKEGQVVKVKVLETDDKGRVKLSMKALIDRENVGTSVMGR